jgi:regulator of RNase E activity RraA
MPMDALPDAVLEELRAWNTPSVSNAVELFDVRPRNEGFASGEIRCIFPHFPVMVGYAVTATIRAATQPPPDARARTLALYDHVLTVPAPRVVVIKDLDTPQAAGSFWGEVNGNTFKAHGCIGVVTTAACATWTKSRRSVSLLRPLRDRLSRVRARGGDRHSCEIGGLTIHPGDLIHADKHGVMTVPLGSPRARPRGRPSHRGAERALIDFCKSPTSTRTDCASCSGRPQPQAPDGVAARGSTYACEGGNGVWSRGRFESRLQTPDSRLPIPDSGERVSAHDHTSAAEQQ